MATALSCVGARKYASRQLAQRDGSPQKGDTLALSWSTPYLGRLVNPRSMCGFRVMVSSGRPGKRSIVGVMSGKGRS